MSNTSAIEQGPLAVVEANINNTLLHVPNDRNFERRPQLALLTMRATDACLECAYALPDLDRARALMPQRSGIDRQ